MRGRRRRATLIIFRLMQYLWLLMQYDLLPVPGFIYCCHPPIISLCEYVGIHMCHTTDRIKRIFVFECLRNYIWETLKNTWYLWTWQNYTLQCDFIIITQFIAQTVVEMLNHDFAQIKACLDIFQNRCWVAISRSAKRSWWCQEKVHFANLRCEVHYCAVYTAQ